MRLHPPFTCVYRSVLISLICVGLPLAAFSQDNITAFPSPDGAAMIHAIQNPVDYHTGTVNVQVPLYTFASGGIQVPVGLSYRTSGIKIEDRATSVGLGWRLSAGGRITRIVKSLPDDDIDYGWCSVFWQARDNWTQRQWINFLFDGGAVEGYISGLLAEIGIFNSGSILDKLKYKLIVRELIGQIRFRGDIDTEPDVFFFEIPGYSGMFVMDHLGQAHTIPYQNVLIQWVNKTYFKIKDPNGSEYILGNTDHNRETTVATRTNEYSLAGGILPFSKTSTYVSTWHLSKITDITGQEVNLKYQDLNEFEQTSKNTSYSFTYHYDYQYIPSGDERREYIENPKEYETSIAVNIAAPKIIHTITSNNSGNSLVFENNGDRVEKIVVKNSTKEALKEIVLQYETRNSRNFLTSLSEKVGQSRKPICQFEYNRAYNFPADTYDYDLWGFYNGRGNMTHFPAGKVFGKRLFHINDLINEDQRIISPVVKNINNVPTADRAPSLKHTMTHVLQAIKYPTGGEVRYVYELNEQHELGGHPYYLESVSVPDSLRNKIGGLRIREIHNVDSDGKILKTRYDYHESGVVPIGQIVMGITDYYGYKPEVNGIYRHLYTYHASISSRPINNHFDINGNAVTYSMVTETAPDGDKTTYEYSGNRHAEYQDELSDLYVDFWTPPYAKNTTEGQENDEFYTGMPNSSRHWMRGLLLSITKKNRADSVISKSSYVYKIYRTFKSVVHGYVPHYIIHNEEYDDKNGGQSYKMLCDYTWDSQPVYLDSVIVEKGPYNLYSDMKYEYDTTYLVPKKVITTDAEGNKTEVRTTYNFDYLNANAPSGSQQYAMTKLHNDHVVVPVEQITVRQKAGTNESMVLSGSLTQFTIDGKPRPNRKYSLLSESPVALTNYVPLSVTSGNMNYDQRYRLMQTVDNYDAKLNPITVTDNIAKLTKSVVLDSYGRPIAEVSNAVRSLDPGRTNQVFHTSFEDSASRVPNGSAKSGKYVNAGNYSLTLSNFELGDYRLSYWQSADNGATWTQQKQTITVGNNTNTFSINSTGWIDEVRLMPLDARMTTCTYDDLGHKSSETDANGVTTYYEYDGFGRLTRVLDNDRNLLKEYFFGYKQ